MEQIKEIENKNLLFELCRFIDIDQGQKLHLWRSDPVETSFPSLISSICSCGSTKMQANEGAASPSWIAAGLSSGHCRLLDMRSGNIITSWQAHEGYVTKVCTGFCFHPIEPVS